MGDPLRTRQEPSQGRSRRAGAGRRDPVSNARRRSTIPAALAAALVLAVAGARVCAQGDGHPPFTSLPTDALDWTDPGVEAALSAVERLEAELTPWGQVDLSARLDPVVRYRDYPRDGEGGEIVGRVGLSARIDFADPGDTHARALQTLERRRQALSSRRIRGVRDALLAHAYLLIAQEQEAVTLRNLTDADDARVRAADLDHRQAQQNLREARAEAVAHGLAPSAHYRPLRFRLPAPPNAADIRLAHGYRLLELQLLEAEAELSEARAAPLDDLRLRAAYRVRAGQIEAEGGLINGRPSATMGIALPGGVERWEVQLSAQLVLDDSWREVHALEEAVAAAAEELSGFPERYRREVEFALAGAELAGEEVDLAEDQLEEQGLAEAGSERALASARIRFYRAWIAYIRATASLLELTGGAWEALDD